MAVSIEDAFAVINRIVVAVEEYETQAAERGPRGGKPTVARMAGEGRHLANVIQDALGAISCPTCGCVYGGPDWEPCPTRQELNTIAGEYLGER